MKIIIAGLGPGNPELVTLEALNHARSSDVIIAPRSRKNTPGVAENIIAHHLPDAKIIPVLFPMITDTEQRDKIILEQLTDIQPVDKIFFPVIGDSMLYSTGAYLLDVWRKIIPDIDAEFVPGISAHSLAAACAKKFLAMNTDILSIIPGTADREKIINVMKYSDTVAIYKPTALKDLHELAKKFTNIIRVDFAGIPGKEKVITGDEALNDIHEYLSIILLWR